MSRQSMRSLPRKPYAAIVSAQPSHASGMLAVGWLANRFDQLLRAPVSPWITRIRRLKFLVHPCSRVGSLVSDEFYHPDIEGIGISYHRHAPDGKLLRALYASNVNAYDPGIVDLLCELEQVHDGASVDQWPYLLAALGKRYGFV